MAWGSQEQGEIGSHYYVENPIYPLDNTLAMLQLDAVDGGEGFHLEVQGFRKQDALFYAIQQSKALVDGRLQITVPDKINKLPLEWLYSPAVRFDHARIGNTSDQTPFRDAGIQTLLIVWRGASEENLSDELADEINLDRLFITEKMVTTTLMMIAR